ncbi:hypothetical protein [Mycobacterium asiaticum]|uniref:Isoniazid-inducible protein iniC n=1 Tax=Mycobacterium asiaticum TaxID=1790 RepID=A0A1A3N3B0_MYCAS|nr:hypothetical protein [Mycobacterium asiaticum]OBK14857.1 hypothetical protein A5636_07150 [Mycobacterium asiaticum]
MEVADQRILAVAERMAAPLRVAVRGRPGVGRRTVAAALDRVGGPAGLTVATEPPAQGAELQVYVIAEVAKPEDADAGATLGVLNKADLGGFARGDNPITAAGARCVDFAELVGAPMLPMSGLLAVAAFEGFDATSWAALRELAADPGGLASLDGGFDGFLTAQFAVPVRERQRLLRVLDLFGLALAVAAVRRGAGPGGVRAILRRVSGVDAIVQRLVVAGAQQRYRRVLDAIAELEVLAIGDARIGAFLSSDDTAAARMAAAIDLAQAQELELGPTAPLQRAVHWQRYRRTAAVDLHRACAAEITRGSLRLWSRAGGVPVRDGREAR